MSSDPQRVQAVFLGAVRKTEAERAEFLDHECGGDSELRRRVEALISAHDQSGSFLDAPLNEVTENSPTLVHPALEQVGTLIGPFKLLQQIGEGGMGAVFMAEQIEPVERRAALKIIKPGMDTKAVIARFEAERQALAMMDHPNIAKVLDVGTTDSGRPYFVMELVRGIPITQYCDEHRLTPRLRLELFLPVCQAVQHAHQKGIIHRDIKPSNVLVAEYDDRAVPMIIDFGLAKAMEKRLTAKTMFTEFGQVVGTPDYMSPEQAKLNQLDIDTRSDIYSLGVLLYELLSGNTPFDRQRMRSAAFDELLRIIREEEPPRPSQRLSTVDMLPSIAANRHMTPAELTRQLSGELDWIVMKSLEKDRSRRYDTANGLADDLRRYLDDEPVEACPPSTSHRFRKFAKRNKTQLAILIVAVTVLVVAATSALIAAGRFRDLARRNGQLASEKVEALAGETQSKIAANGAKRDAEHARDEALQRLFASLLSEAKASRWSRRPGQRTNAKAAITRAVALFRNLDLGDEARRTLRDEAVAAMSLPDVSCVATWSGLPSTNSLVLNDDTLSRCAILEARKNRVRFTQVDDLDGTQGLLAIPQRVQMVAVSPDLDWVVVYHTGRADLHNRHSGFVKRFPRTYFHAHDFSPDGRHILTREGLDIKRWNVIVPTGVGWLYSNARSKYGALATPAAVELLEDRVLLAFDIVPTFASNITSDPNAAAIMNSINTVIAAYESFITNDITVDITFQKGGGLGVSSGGLNYQINYTDYRAALVTQSTTANDALAIASLPTSTLDPVNNNNSILVRSPLARALGFTAPNAGGAAGDGTITLNTEITNLDRTSSQDATKFDLQSVVAHEIDAVMRAR